MLLVFFLLGRAKFVWLKIMMKVVTMLQQRCQVPMSHWQNAADLWVARTQRSRWLYVIKWSSLKCWHQLTQTWALRASSCLLWNVPTPWLEFAWAWFNSWTGFCLSNELPPELRGRLLHWRDQESKTSISLKPNLGQVGQLAFQSCCQTKLGERSSTKHPVSIQKDACPL